MTNFLFFLIGVGAVLLLMRLQRMEDEAHRRDSDIRMLKHSVNNLDRVVNKLTSNN